MAHFTTSVLPISEMGYATHFWDLTIITHLKDATLLPTFEIDHATNLWDGGSNVLRNTAADWPNLITKRGHGDQKTDRESISPGETNQLWHNLTNVTIICH